MSVKSMTGFGSGAAGSENRNWSVEVKSVNNRYLDLKMKLPRGYTQLEERIRSMVAEFFERGRVDLMVSVNGDFSDLVELKVNNPLALKYRQVLADIAKDCDVEDSVSSITIASFPDVLLREQKTEDLEESVWPYLQQALSSALVDCDKMRGQEGSALADDLLSRLSFFEKTIDEIEQHIPKFLEQREAGLKERLDKLLEDSNIQIDPMRLAQEVAVLADKTDVTEEVVRLRSHIEQFRGFLNEVGGVGRKLDFLIQEFLREVNTIASKINAAEVAHLTVALKSELEKMREQVQNIE